MSESVPKTESWFTGWRKLALVLLGLLLIGFAVLETAKLRSRAQWKRCADAIRAKGEPVTLAELEALRAQVPDEQNGALVIERLADKLDGIDDAVSGAILLFRDTSQPPDLSEALPARSINRSRALVASHASLLDELGTLRGMTTGRISVCYADCPPSPLDFMLPNLKAWKNAGRLLGLDAVVKLTDGDIEGAAKNVVLQARVAATLDNEPNLIVDLVQTLIQREAVTTLETVMRSGELSEPTLNALAEEIDARLGRDGLKPAFLGERVFFIALCDALASRLLSAPDEGANTPSWVVWFWEPVIRTDQRSATELYTRLVDAPHARATLAAARDIEAGFEARVGSLRDRMSVWRFMPSFSRAVQVHMLGVARLRCARVALAAERFRLETGRLPKSLHELVPDHLPGVPEDPFDGKPLRFAETDQGIVIYSIGENETDDGGDLTPPNKKQPGPDVGFRLLKPEHRGLIITGDVAPDGE